MVKILVLETNPTKYHFNAETWAATLISEVLFKEHNIIFSTDNIYILLKKKLHLRHSKGKGFFTKQIKKNIKLL